MCRTSGPCRGGVSSAVCAAAIFQERVVHVEQRARNEQRGGQRHGAGGAVCLMFEDAATWGAKSWEHGEECSGAVQLG